MLFITYIDLFIFLGGCLSFLLALTVIIKKNHTPMDAVIFIVYLLLSYIVLNQLHYVHFYNFFGKQPIFIPFILGPVLYFYMRALFTSSVSFVKKDLLHFVSALISIVLFNTIKILTMIFTQSHEIINQVKSIKLIYIMNILGLCHVLIYLVYIVYKLEIFKIIREEKGKYIPLAIITFISVILSSWFGALVFPDIIGERIPLILLSSYIIFQFLIISRYPHIGLWFQQEVRKKKYEKSLLLDKDVDVIKERLMDIMEIDKPYLDEELSLAILAEEMKIPSHQLSELLNNKLNMNFNTFINRYRIDEAKKMILDDPQLSVLSVGYAVGFNSKSVFNRSFQQFCGESPTQFKNKHK